MNYYEHHLGDYAKDAAHLSLVEDGAYRRLLDAYYTREQPLPGDLKLCCKLARAITKSERDAVKYVLNEFFDLRDDEYHQARCDAELARFKEREKEGDARRENEAERQRRHRERRKELFDALRPFGIVPKFDTPTAELEHILSRQITRDGHTPVTRDTPPPVTRDATATHKPVTSNQSPDQVGSTSVGQTLRTREAVTTDRPEPATAALACIAMREAGAPRVNPTHPKLLAGIAEGATAAMYGDAVREAIEAGKGEPFAYALATVRSRLREASQPTPHGNANGNRRPSRKLSAVEQVEQAIRARRESGAESTLTGPD